jgi:hypothetical protein
MASLRPAREGSKTGLGMVRRDGGKVEKIWIENRRAVTLFLGTCTIESENIDFLAESNAFFEERLWT